MSLLTGMFITAGIVWGGLLIYASNRVSQKDHHYWEQAFAEEGFVDQVNDAKKRIKSLEDRVHDLEIRHDERVRLTHDIAK
jgi:hypothetical protein